MDSTAGAQCRGVYSYALDTCTTTWILSSVCLVMDATNARIDSTAAGGCVVLDSFLLSTNAVPSGVVYDSTTHLSRYGYSMIAAPSNYLDNVEVTVRSVKDPYVTALRITDGSLGFGLTQGQKFATGIVLISLGSFFLLLPCILYKCFKSVRSNACTHTSTSPVSSTAPLSPNAWRPPLLSLWQMCGGGNSSSSSSTNSYSSLDGGRPVAVGYAQPAVIVGYVEPSAYPVAPGAYPTPGTYPAPTGAYPAPAGAYPAPAGAYPAPAGGYPGGYPAQTGYPADAYQPQGAYPAGAYPGAYPTGAYPPATAPGVYPSRG